MKSSIVFSLLSMLPLMVSCTKTEYQERLSYSMDDNRGTIWYYSCNMDATVNLDNNTAAITLSKFEPDWAINRITFDNMAKEIISRDHPGVRMVITKQQ